MEYVRVTKYDDIVNLIYEFKDVFPNITVNEQTAESFAEKFSKHANVIQLTFYNEVAGMAVYYANDMKQKIGYISLIGLKKEFRGKHLGRDLLKFVIDDMRTHNMNFVKLECADININAYHFYCKMGLKPAERAGKESLYMTMCL